MTRQYTYGGHGLDVGIEIDRLQSVVLELAPDDYVRHVDALAEALYVAAAHTVVRPENRREAIRVASGLRPPALYPRQNLDYMTKRKMR